LPHEQKARAPPAVDFNRYIDQEVMVKFIGGREVTGILKGWDKRINIVLDNAVERLRDPSDPLVTSDKTRALGFVVCRSTAVVTITPTEGLKEIPNPFAQASE